MNDVFNNPLIKGNTYCYYLDINGVFTINYGILTNIKTPKGFSSLTLTKSKLCRLLGEQIMYENNSKVSVKPFKLIPYNE